MAESTAARTFAGYRYSACPSSLTWGSFPFSDDDRPASAQSTSATLMPSADVPLITPATIIEVLLMRAVAGVLRSPELPDEPVPQIPTVAARAARPLL